MGSPPRLRHRPPHRASQRRRSPTGTRAPSTPPSSASNQKRWISASWGISENNRKAKFYAITRTGQKQLCRRSRKLATHHRHHRSPDAAESRLMTPLLHRRRQTQSRLLERERSQSELDTHIALLTEDNLRKGMTQEEAIRKAKVALGSHTQISTKPTTNKAASRESKPSCRTSATAGARSSKAPASPPSPSSLWPWASARTR